MNFDPNIPTKAVLPTSLPGYSICRVNNTVGTAVADIEGAVQYGECSSTETSRPLTRSESRLTSVNSSVIYGLNVAMLEKRKPREQGTRFDYVELTK